MFIQLTSAGLSLLQQGPFALTEYKLGSGSNYIPTPDQTDIQGSEVYSGTPGPAFPISGNVVRYSMLLDRAVGDFQFGELGLYVGTELVAIGVMSEPLTKTETTEGVDGNMLRLDAFLSMVSSTYEMWLNIGDTDSQWVVSNVALVDYLPPSHNTTANAYIVGSANENQLAFFAYSDRSGLWAFDQYKYSTTITTSYTVVAATPTSVVIQSAALLDKLRPVDIGELIVQFITGADFGICRNIQSATQDLTNDRLSVNFVTPLAIVPAAEDKFVVYNRDPINSRFVSVDFASKSSRGVVQIGRGISVDTNAVIAVDRTDIPNGVVYSITGKDTSGNPASYQGDVQLHGRDIIGAVTSVNDNTPDGNGNVDISSSDVGAIPLTQKAQHGGVSTLDGTPTDDPSDRVVQYVKGRLPVEQAPLAVLNYKGLWNPGTNSGTYMDDLGVVHTIQLLDTGLMTDTVGNSTVTLPGTGSIFKVSNSGQYELDSNTSWTIGDLVVGISDEWVKISATVPNQYLELGVSIPSNIPSGEIAFYQVISRDVQTTSLSRALCLGAPSLTVTFNILVNGTQAGTVVFTNGSATGTVTMDPLSITAGSNVQLMTSSQLNGLSGFTLSLVFQIQA